MSRGKQLIDVRTAPEQSVCGDTYHLADAKRGKSYVSPICSQFAVRSKAGVPEAVQAARDILLGARRAKAKTGGLTPTGKRGRLRSRHGGTTMRFRVISLAIVGLLALAGAAAAQDQVATTVYVPERAYVPDPFSKAGAEGGEQVASRQSRYQKKLETLTAKVALTKARDGGQLTPEHEASLKRERDNLNRTYGFKPG